MLYNLTEWHVIQTVSDQAISGQITCPRPLFTVNVNTPVIFRNRISCGRYLSASLGIFGRAGGCAVVLLGVFRIPGQQEARYKESQTPPV